MPTRPAPILIATYPRSGSTALYRVIEALWPGEPSTLHEPFSRYSGPDWRLFDDRLDELITGCDVMKHHAASICTPRQNRMLYRRWLARGGRIVHLLREDLTAQARSLVIARALNSFHRRHLVGQVPAERVNEERRQLALEVAQQSAVLAEFETVECRYEAVLAGPLDARRDAVDRLVQRLDPVLADRLAVDEVQERVATILDPARQTRSEAPDFDIALIDQVPRFAGCEHFDSTVDIEALRDALLGAALSLPWRTLHGVGSCRVDHTTLDEPVRVAVADVLAAVGRSVQNHSRARVRPNGPVLELVLHSGVADNDQNVWVGEPHTTDPGVHFCLELGSPDGSTEIGPGVHLAGRGFLDGAATAGAVSWWASGVGARRGEATGTWASLAGVLELRPGQLLTVGQLRGDGGAFRAADAPEEA